MQTSSLNKELKQYYREIEKFLLCDKKQKRNILDTLKSSVECYISDNQITEFEDVVKHFGSPEVIAQGYYNDEKTEELAKTVKNGKKMAAISIAVAIIAFGLLAVLFAMQADSYSGYDVYSVIENSFIQAYYNLQKVGFIL